MVDDELPDAGRSSASSVTGASTAAATLKSIGVDTVFCLPGEETIALLECLAEANIELVVARHEQHAAFMASAHGRLTGRPGVLVTTLGPGVTNATTGLAQATLSGYPVLHIGGQKPLRGNSEGSFQVLDLPKVADPVTKATFRLTDPQEVAATLGDAYRVAMDGRPGAVFVELPTDVSTATVDNAADLTITHEVAGGRIEAAQVDIDVADRRLAAARRPVVVVAGGAQSSEVSTALTAFVDRLDLPVVALQTGLGVVSAAHRCALPAIGMHRPDAAHLPLVEADLVLTIGYDPVEHPPMAWNRSNCDVIHIASWPAAIRRGYAPAIELVGDIAATIGRLAGDESPARRDRIETYRAAVDAQLSDESLRSDDPSAETVDAVQTIDVVEALREVLDDDDIVALDNGSYKLWFARHFPARRTNGLLLDNALATMGAGLGTATEAARLERDRRVVAVVGDGGFMMNVGDLETALRLGLDNLTVLVLRDDTYGFIADHQRERDRRRVAVDIGNPDFVALAEAFGAVGVRHEPDRDLAATLLDAIGLDAVTVVDCAIDERADDALRRFDSLAGALRRLGSTEGSATLATSPDAGASR